MKRKVQDQRPLLTRRQVADRLGVHTNSVKNYQHRGLLGAVVINSCCVRYEAAEVERFIRESKSS